MNYGKAQKDFSASLILLWCTELSFDKLDIKRKQEESVCRKRENKNSFK